MARGLETVEHRIYDRMILSYKKFFFFHYLKTIGGREQKDVDTDSMIVHGRYDGEVRQLLVLYAEND